MKPRGVLFTKPARPFTDPARARVVPSRPVDGPRRRMSAMDIVAVILGVISFALLYALLEGIDRI